jgi:DNA-binding SARP family transcriptional activator
MAALNLFLLGGFELCSSAGTPVTVAAKRAKALLAYLAVSAGRAHPRDKLAGLLWEEREEAQARHNLRQVLASLRRSLPEVDRILLADSETLALRLEGIEVDVRAFEGLTRAGTPESLPRQRYPAWRLRGICWPS